MRKIPLWVIWTIQSADEMSRKKYGTVNEWKFGDIFLASFNDSSQLLTTEAE